MGSYAGYIVQTLVTLLAVCALAFVVLYGARRLGIGRPRGPIELVGLLPLDARRAIYLVKVGRQVLVVGAYAIVYTVVLIGALVVKVVQGIASSQKGS